MKAGEKPGTSPVLGHLDHRIISTIREPLLVLDGALRVISANASFYRTFKVLATETEGRLIYELGNYQWNIPQLRELLTSVLSTDQAFQDFEVEHDFPEIGRRTMLLNARHLSQGKDEPNNLILLAIEDVTERKRAEQLLQESENRFRALVKASSGAVYRMNPGWSEMLYLQGREFIPDTESPSQTWLEKYIPPDNQPYVLAAINEAIRTKSTFELEYAVLRADGSLGWTHSRAVPILDTNRDIIEWFGAASDITARKQAEEASQEQEAKFRAAIETSGDGFCVSDMAGRFLEFNDAYVNLLGYSREELLKMSVPDIEAQFRGPEIGAIIKRIKSEGHTSFETKFRTKDGRVWPAEVNVSYWPIADGRMFVFLRDITERKKAEENLQKAHDELEQRVAQRT
jgi:PAS domain S-box-containing protein